jgi:hypothetical protein
MKNFILKEVTSLLFVILLFSCASRRIWFTIRILMRRPQEKSNSSSKTSAGWFVAIVSAEDPEIAALLI